MRAAQRGPARSALRYRAAVNAISYRTVVPAQHTPSRSKRCTRVLLLLLLLRSWLLLQHQLQVLHRMRHRWLQ